MPNKVEPGSQKGVRSDKSNELARTRRRVRSKPKVDKDKEEPAQPKLPLKEMTIDEVIDALIEAKGKNPGRPVKSPFNRNMKSRSTRVAFGYELPRTRSKRDQEIRDREQKDRWGNL